MKQVSPSAKKYAAIATIVGWITLLLQLYISIINRKVGIAEAILQYFSFFTILSNIITTLSYTSVWLYPAHRKLQLLTRTSSLTAVTVYIVMVGIISNTLLLGLISFSGLQLIVDKFLHIIIPASMLLLWILFVSKRNLKWKCALLWLWYPVVYVVYIMILGGCTGFYPYPFANVSKLGYSKALLNGVYITIAFGIVSLIFIAIAKIIEKRKNASKG